MNILCNSCQFHNKYFKIDQADHSQNSTLIVALTIISYQSYPHIVCYDGGAGYLDKTCYLECGEDGTLLKVFEKATQ